MRKLEHSIVVDIPIGVSPDNSGGDIKFLHISSRSMVNLAIIVMVSDG